MPENGSGVVVCSSSLLLCSHPGRRQAETPLIQPVQKSRASSDIKRSKSLKRALGALGHAALSADLAKAQRFDLDSEFAAAADQIMCQRPSSYEHVLQFCRLPFPIS